MQRQQHLHHRTYKGKDLFKTKIVGVRNAKKSRNTPGLRSMYRTNNARFTISWILCFLFLFFLFLTSKIKFYIIKRTFYKKNLMMFNMLVFKINFRAFYLFIFVLHLINTVRFNSFNQSTETLLSDKKALWEKLIELNNFFSFN